MKKEKILVTGATGFIGYHVVQWLINSGFDVVASGTGNEKAKQFEWYNSVDFIPCDYYADDLNYYEHFGKPDLLIHLGWKGLPNYMMRFHMEENLFSEMRFVRSFIDSGRTKVVVIGTCYEYGAAEGCLSEETPANPVTMYATAKDALRRYISFIAKENEIQWNWIRLFFLYGEGQSPRSLLPQLDAAIERGDAEFPMSGGEQLRDYLPVEKVAEYICRIALQDSVDGIVNCCSGDPISVRKLVEERVAGKKSSIKLKLGVYDYPVYEGMSFWGDNRLLKRCIGDL
ncbi:NAD-dependent epimerase/dehydratase family protein [Methanolacinia paynteri]|uniref:NAD-dependent epimerase/dehydratase family protein n=1 Tax=Methanolacinia paynteri TaxID=230356 RepID=UPI001B802276|nr:NAD-dependent epimerase/dehydratase family protein [Methanolacinia paynteri]